MLKIKLINKKILLSIFVFSILLNVYLSTISNYDIFDSQKANSIFARFNIFTNTVFMIIVLLTASVKFYSYLNTLENSQSNLKSMKLIIKRKNLGLFFQLFILTSPFVIWYFVHFLVSEENRNWKILAFVLATFAGILLLVIFALYFVYRFIKKVIVFESYEEQFQEMLEDLYFNSIFLDVINYDEKNYVIELRQEIKTFLSSKNIENDNDFNISLAEFLADNKKATVPPLLR